MKTTLRSIGSILLVLGCAGGQALASEVSAVAGLYSSKSSKTEGASNGGESAYTISGRYHDALTTTTAWFVNAGLDLRTYQAPDGGTSPDNYTGFLVGGGLRKYFTPFSTYVVPYLAGSARYRTYQTVSVSSANNYTQTKYAGIYYGGAAGVRIGLDQSFFLELEIPFFDSALFATVTEDKTTTAAGVTTKTRTVTTYNELYADTSENMTAMTIGIGMKL